GRREGHGARHLLGELALLLLPALIGGLVLVRLVLVRLVLVLGGRLFLARRLLLAPLVLAGLVLVFVHLVAALVGRGRRRGRLGIPRPDDSGQERHRNYGSGPTAHVHPPL